MRDLTPRRWKSAAVAMATCAVVALSLVGTATPTSADSFWDFTIRIGSRHNRHRYRDRCDDYRYRGDYYRRDGCDDYRYRYRDRYDDYRYRRDRWDDYRDRYGRDRCYDGRDYWRYRR